MVRYDQRREGHRRDDGQTGPASVPGVTTSRQRVQHQRRGRLVIGLQRLAARAAIDGNR